MQHRPSQKLAHTKCSTSPADNMKMNQEGHSTRLSICVFGSPSKLHDCAKKRLVKLRLSQVSTECELPLQQWATPGLVQPACPHSLSDINMRSVE